MNWNDLRSMKCMYNTCDKIFHKSKEVIMILIFILFSDHPIFSIGNWPGNFFLSSFKVELVKLHNKVQWSVNTGHSNTASIWIVFCVRYSNGKNIWVPDYNLEYFWSVFRCFLNSAPFDDHDQWLAKKLVRVDLLSTIYVQ